MNRYLALLFINLISLTIQAQIDTEFWFAVPEISIEHADKPIYLRVSTMDAAATVKIDAPASSTMPSFTRTIPANNTYSFELTNYINEIESSPFNTILNKGLHITSTAEITAYYEVLGSSYLGGVNCDIFTLKGKNALGKEFYIPLQNFWDNFSGQQINAYSSFDIIATEDNTSITITPSQDLAGGRLASVPFTIILNKGQTFSCQSLSTLGALHASGSLVTSDKPIAITIKDDSMYEAPGWDLAGDQLVPVEHTGTEYIIIKASSHESNTDRIFICATANNTDIFLKGNPSPVATIQAGETYSYHLTQDDSLLYVTASQPIYINHLGGFSYELAGAILPPLLCTGSRRVSFTRPNTDPLLINLIVKAGKEQYFKLNGSSSFPASSFQFVEGTNNEWVAGSFNIPNNKIYAYANAMVSNDSADFQMSIMSGTSNTFRYGFFSDFAGLELGPDKSMCFGDSLLLNAGFGKSSYEWNTGATTQKIYVKNAGTYSVEITKGTCVLQDDITISLNPPVQKFFTISDTSLCANSQLTIGTDSVYNTYKWNTGANTPKINPTLSGNYKLEVTNEYGCKKTDSILVTFLPLPKATISYSGMDENICWDSIITLNAGIGPFQYLWSTGKTTQSITTNPYFDYKLNIVDNNGCKDSTYFTIDCSPYIRVFNLVTPDNNDLNDVFYVEKLQPGKWILEVYNRWGARVYYNKAYDNSFGAEDLADDVYYFTLKHIDGKKTHNGWFQVIRK